MKFVFAFVFTILMMIVSPSVLAKVNIVLEIDDIPNMGQRRDRNKELPWRVTRFASDDSITVVAKLEEFPGLTNITLEWSIEVDGKPVALFDKDGNPVPNNKTTGPVANHEVRFEISSKDSAYYEIDAQADYSGGYSTANADLEVIGDFQLKAVTFDSSADKGGPYDQGKHFYEIVQDIEKKTYRHNKKKDDPHWLDNDLDGNAENKKAGDQKFPISIRRSKKDDDVFLAVAAEIAIKKNGKVDKDKAIYVRAFGPGNLELLPQKATVKGKSIITKIADMKPKMPQSILFVKSAKFRWEISFDEKKTWEYVGSSRNPFYVMWDKPLDKNKLYHTYVHVGCVGGHGVGGTNVLVPTRAIFDKGGFVGQDLKTEYGKALVYYKQWISNITKDPDELVTNPKMDNGTCDAFAGFFIRTLHTQGIDHKNEYSTISPSVDTGNDPKVPKIADNMLINDFVYSAATLPPGARNGIGTSATHAMVHRHPIKNGQVVQTAPFDDSKFTWIPAPGNVSVTDQNGVVAVGKAIQNNPLSLFTYHVLVKITTNHDVEYYDPSYGLRNYTSLKNYEDTVVSGYSYTQPRGPRIEIHLIVKNNTNNNTPAGVSEVVGDK